MHLSFLLLPVSHVYSCRGAKASTQMLIVQGHMSVTWVSQTHAVSVPERGRERESPFPRETQRVGGLLHGGHRVSLSWWSSLSKDTEVGKPKTKSLATSEKFTGGGKVASSREQSWDDRYLHFDVRSALSDLSQQVESHGS